MYKSSVASSSAISLLLLFVAGPAAAQSSAESSRRWELRVTGGAFVPTGEQREALGDAHLSAVQVSWLVRPALAITGTIGWARSRDRTLADSPKLDVFTSDVGIEARPVDWFTGRAMTFSPFVGAGVGARSYNHRALKLDATHNVAAYGAFGGEIGMGRVGLRLEARDYVSRFKPLTSAGSAATRSDVSLLVGLRFNRHHNTKR